MLLKTIPIVLLDYQIRVKDVLPQNRDELKTANKKLCKRETIWRTSSQFRAVLYAASRHICTIYLVNPGAKVGQKPRKQDALFENEDLTKKISAVT
jgi:hypothetical protein